MTDAFSDSQTPAISADPLAELVGEGKKFADVAALAKGKVEADAFIVKLQNEAAALRAQINPQFDAEAQLAQLREEMAALRANPPAKPSGPVTPEALTEDRIAKLVNETITRAEQNRSAQQNVDDANGAVISHFGTLEAAAAAVKARAAELKTTPSELKAIAEKSPTLFKQIMQLEVAKGADGTPLTPRAITPSGPVVGQPKEGTKEYFDAILKASPRKYWTPQVQAALHKAAREGTYQL